MNCTKISLSVPGAFLTTYFLKEDPDLLNSHTRPMLLICPGGAYSHVSNREAEPVAIAFGAKGFNTCVLTYPIAPARYPSALICLAEAVAWLRTHAKENSTDPERIFVCGFSAGGHLAAHLGVTWDKPFLSELTGLTPQLYRPNRLLLCYPVITSGPFAHRGSFDNLLGPDPDPELLNRVSLENQVSAATPPTFLWTTYTDEMVPAENTLLFMQALRKAHVPFEAHIYSVGEHGLSLANEETVNALGRRIQPECVGWTDLAASWLLREA